jgi:hypothetical protein
MVYNEIEAGMSAFEALVDFGEERMRAVARGRGLGWESMSEGERKELVDDLLHRVKQAQTSSLNAGAGGPTGDRRPSLRVEYQESCPKDVNRDSALHVGSMGGILLLEERR